MKASKTIIYEEHTLSVIMMIKIETMMVMMVMMIMIMKIMIQSIMIFLFPGGGVTARPIGGISGLRFFGF